ncbi:c-type cytochrome [Biformimicrobium ophioploci]|uniref:Cytochrome c5 family protein n=1 Tax=Biformimicrobium ophioploci TaxID=3036711 RepID=A0ABQ6LV29_9GAMM|nr:cytochrome c5 family protein [Microbulbifer sp. NKW57]GMG85959.1 cytochrome c5 family protein [Microbulbifer sp. NKW57]
MKNMLSLLLAAGLVMGTAFAGADDEKIKNRIAPVGSVCMAGDECAAAAPAQAATGGEARSGEDVYKASCFSCHGTGAAGAPRFGDAAAWTDRIGKGMDTLYSNAINGINAMPAKGLCMTCSDDEIKAAVDYMVEGSK